MTEASLSVGDVITLVTAFGVIAALFSNVTNLRAKGRENNPAIIEMRQDLKYIRAAIDKQEGVSAEHARVSGEMATRLAIVEASVKSAHKRLDDHLAGEGGQK